MNRALSNWDQVHVERLVKVHEQSMPTDQEIAEAASRLLGGRTRSHRGGVRLLLAALVQGFVIGLAVLASAAFVADRVAERARSNDAPPPQTVTPDTRRPPRAPVASPDVAPPASPPSPAPRAAEVPAPVEAPRAASSTPNRVAGFAPLAPDSDGSSLPASVPDARTAEGPWQRVARALSSGDLNEADRHLRELETSADAETRDAAELARAELFISHGRGAPFRASVMRLSTSGSTALIRKRASALLTRPF